jgi:hypothetical protein
MSSFVCLDPANDRFPSGKALTRLIIGGLDETPGHLFLTPQPIASLGA